MHTRLPIVVVLLGGSLLMCAEAAAAPVLEPVSTLPLQVWRLSEFRIAGVPLPAGENPFDSDRIAVDVVFTGPAGRAARLPAFWHQGYQRRLATTEVTGKDGISRPQESEVLTPEGEPGWRVRFTPLEAGRHTVRIEVRNGGQAASITAGGELAAQPAAGGARGFVRVNPAARRYFMTDDGRPLILLGECCCWHGRRGTFDYDDWFADYPPNGMNYTRLWMWPNAFGIEVLDGERLHYNLQKAWTLDYVLSLAAEKGIAVMLCLDYHGVFQVDPDMWGGNNWWPRHPYNVSTGGPCTTQNDFFTNADAASLYRKRLRYLIGRYSAQPSLLSWQFFNEINNVYRYLKPDDVVAWHDQMARWLKQTDPYAHPITTSFGSVGEQAAMWKLDSLDYAQWHLYLNWAGRYRHPAAACADVSERFQRDYGKPLYLGEYGTDGRGWKTDADPYRRGLQQAVWGGVMTGTAGTAMPWWWEGMHAAKVHGIWKSLAGFIEGTGLGGALWAPLRLPAPARPAARLGPVLAGQAPFDVTIEAFGDWGSRPSGTMAIATVDAAQPSELPRFVHGTDKPGMRVPCTLVAEFAEGATVTVHVNSVSNGARLSIRVDGAERLGRDLPNRDGKTLVNNEYNEDVSAPVPAGRHTIEIANPGADWFAIDWVRLSRARPCGAAPEVAGAPAVLAYGLSDGRDALLWVIDPRFEYPQGATEADPPVVNGAQVTLPGLPDGRYAVTWWDPWQGAAMGTAVVSSTQGGLTLQLPDFRVDLAARVKRAE